MEKRHMTINLHVGKWGSSLAVRIPKAIADQCEVTEGSALEMNAEDGQIVLKKQAYDLDKMLSMITPENCHPEQEIGESQGNEQW